MPIMRAKMRISGIARYEGSETLLLHAVAKNDGYPADGADEDNSFARWTPCAELQISITNPQLLGRFKEGETYYLDFTLAGE